MEIDNLFFDELMKIVSQIRLDNNSDKKAGIGREKYIQDNVQLIKDDKERFFKNELKIGLWGAFSSGKSSFLNALLGENILPVSVKETTSMITEIKFGERTGIEIFFNNDSIWHEYSRELAFALLTKFKNYDEVPESVRPFVNEAKFEEASKQISDYSPIIKKTVLYLQKDFLKDGLIFIDLPGLEGNSQNSSLTEKSINECDIVLYLKSSDRPLDENDSKILNNLSAKINKRVIFAIRTKSDELFKSYYAEKGKDSHDEEIYEKLRQELALEYSRFKFDEIFLVSPIAYMEISKNPNNALEVLKKEHKSKFRFLKDDSDIHAVSGYNKFSQSFFKAVKEKKEFAKKLKLETDISRQLAHINRDLDNWELDLSKEKEISQADYNRYQEELKKIDEKFQKVINVRSNILTSVKEKISHHIRYTFYHPWVIDGLRRVPLNHEYQNVEAVWEEISKQLVESIKRNIRSPQSERILNKDLKDAYTKFINKLSDVESDLEKFSKRFRREGNALELIEGRNKAYNALSSHLKKDGTLDNMLKGAKYDALSGVAIDLVVGLVVEAAFDAAIGGLFGGMGLSTLIRGAIKGHQNGDGFLIGAKKGLQNAFWGICTIFGSKTAEAKLLLNNLTSEGDLIPFAGKMYQATVANVDASLSNLFAVQLENAINNSNILNILESRIQGEKISLKELFELKEKSFQDKERELERVQALSEKFLKLLVKYKLDSSARRAA